MMSLRLQSRTVQEKFLLVGDALQLRLVNAFFLLISLVTEINLPLQTRSNKSIRTSSTARAISRQALDSPRSPPPADDPPSLISSPRSPAAPVASRLRPLRLVSFFHVHESGLESHL